MLHYSPQIAFGLQYAYIHALYVVLNRKMLADAIQFFPMSGLSFELDAKTDCLIFIALEKKSTWLILLFRNTVTQPQKHSLI